MKYEHDPKDLLRALEGIRDRADKAHSSSFKYDDYDAADILREEMEGLSIAADEALKSAFLKTTRR